MTLPDEKFNLTLINAKKKSGYDKSTQLFAGALMAIVAGVLCGAMSIGAAGAGHGDGALAGRFGLCKVILIGLGCCTIFALGIGNLRSRLRKQPTTRAGNVALIVVGLAFLVAVLNCRFFVDRAMFHAAFRGDAKLCRVLLYLGPRDVNGHLYTAARWGHLEVVRQLVEAGADPSGKLGGKGESVLEGALLNLGERPNGNIEVIRFLVDHGARVDAELIERATQTKIPQSVFDVLQSR